MPGELVWSSVRGKRMRVTRLDECGAPVIGACSTVVSGGFISVQYSQELQDAQEISVLNANSELCIEDPGNSQLKWITAEIAFCGVDPDIAEIITGADKVVNSASKSSGIRVQSGLVLSQFALEVWTDIPNQVCSTTDPRAYGYFLLPFVTQGNLADMTIENDALTFTVSNARTKGGSGWDIGPYDVVETAVPPAVSVPGPLLTPIGPTDHMHIDRVTIAPPAVTDGCVALAA